VVVEVGGGVREYRVGDRAVLDPYPWEAMCDGAHGTVLVPWPNRLAEGRYRFDGLDYQVAITEPDKGNAIHGLLRWRGWEAVRQESNRVTMGIRLYPLTGYPFPLDVAVDYVLDDEGLTVTTTATNRGERTCPYGCGQHPYLSPGDGLVDDAVLGFAAGTRIVTDPQRQLPTGTEPVAGGRCDFSQGRRVGDQRIDFAFTDLARDDAGRAWVRLDGPDGRRAELWVDQTYPIVELFTGDTLSPHRRRRGLGTEPMTCPPNAFQSGEGVHHLGPGQAVTTRWGVRLHTG
jgi:aldose 1-epimerase